MKVDSILFDLDGTLWDSSQQVADSWNIVLKRHNIDRELTVQDLMSVMGMLMDDIMVKLFPELDKDEALQVLEDLCAYENEYVGEVGGVLFPYVEETIKKLADNYKLCIVSNCQAGYIEAFFKAHHMEKYFMDYENPGRTGLDKAGNIRLVVERNGFKNPVYVGDTLGDQKSAKKAGVPFILAEYGFGEVEEYDGIISSIEQLPDLLEA